MKFTSYVLLASLGLTCQQAGAASVKELLEEAFTSPSGNVTAPLDGEMTDLIHRTVPIKGDVMAEVKTIKHFKEQGCRRFSVTMKATFAPETGSSGPVPFPVMELNYCQGGGFPKEGFDNAAGEHFMDQVDQYAKARGLKVPARPRDPSYAPSWAPDAQAQAKAIADKDKQLKSKSGATVAPQPKILPEQANDAVIQKPANTELPAIPTNSNSH